MNIRFGRSYLLIAALAAVMGTGSVLARDLAEIDALATSSRPDNAKAPKFGVDQLKGTRGRMHGRLNVPVFVWGSNDTSLMAPAGSAAAKARWQLKHLGSAYAIDNDEVDALPIKESRDLGHGASLVKFKHTVGGIDVFREEAAVLTNANGNLIAVGGFVSGADKAAKENGAAQFRLQASDAVGRVLADFSFDAAKAAKGLAHTKDGDSYAFYRLSDSTSSSDGDVLAAPARTKQVWYRMPSGLVPAYYVEVQVADSATQSPHYWSYVISAKNGETLFRHSQEADASFKYRVWAESTPPYLPLPGPQGRNGTPHPTGVPDGSQDAFVAPNLITLQNGPISTNDPWLPNFATVTTGNNVDAFADLFAPDDYSPGDIRPDIKPSAGIFDRTYDVTQVPNVSNDQINAAVTNLFYMNNWLHDWYYDDGYDEVAGNGQMTNYGRGGVEGDPIFAEGQDYSGLSNANMSTPADGGRPRMRMYVFTGVASGSVVTTGSPSLNTASIGFSAWGPTSYAIGPQAVVLANDGTANPTRACNPLTNGAAINGNIALIDRGTCTFAVKAQNAQNAGAIGVIIANNAAGVNGMSGSGPTVPAVMVSLTDGNTIKAALAGGPVNATLTRQTDINRDGTIDNTVIAHEWMHHVSNRLVGNASGLGVQVSRGMGEGWSDFNAMLMVVKDGDQLLPNNANWGGVYALAQYDTSGPVVPPSVNNGPYFGIRRYPYSTDMTKNPMTFKHISNQYTLPAGPPLAFDSDHTEVHNTGEVWTTMLWECYANLLNNNGQPFAVTQDRMKRYIIGGLKMTPVNPTFVDARDGILSAIQAMEPSGVDFGLCSAGFAKRGLGAGAIAPDPFDTTNSNPVESYDPGGALEIVNAELSDSPGYCDGDGILDNGETGTLTLTIRNSGFTSLNSTTVSVSSPDATLSFPGGTTLPVPATLPLSTTTVTVPVALSGAAGVTVNEFDVTASDGAVTSPAASFFFRTNLDEVANSSATDNVESRHVVWSMNQSGPSTSPGFAWSRIEDPRYGDPSKNLLWGPDPGAPDVSYVTSPVLQVSASGNFSFDFDHFFGFEYSTGPTTYYDGGVIEISDNGGPWTDIGAMATPTYGGTLYAASGNPIGGRQAYVGYSATFPNTVHVSVALGTAYQGHSVQVRFGSSGDANTSFNGWFVDNIAFSGIDNTPFDAIVPDLGMCRQVSAYAGTPQFTLISTLFGTQLQAKLTDSLGQPQSDVPVTFTAPAAGASGLFSGINTSATVSTDATGVATAPVFKANGTAGAYLVTATAGLQSTSFSLSNATALTGTDQSGNPSVAQTADALLTVQVTPGTYPDSSGITVVADLSSIGGSAAQSFTDAGGGTFTYNATVALGASAGGKSLPVTIGDAEGRSGSTSIALNVLTATAISGSGAATPNSAPAGSAALLAVTVAPGSSPTSSGITVTADLSSIGGSAAQAFYDDGSHGDQTSGDNVFSFSATIGGSTAPGIYIIPVSISDAQNRTASTTVAINVPAPGALSGSGLAVPGSVGLAETATLVVSVVPGTSPTSTGVTVYVDLSSIGGDAQQAFYDDGTHGDQTAGDNIFTFVATVPSNTILGAKSLSAIIKDLQLRTGNATVSLTVVQGADVIFENGFE